MKNEAPSPGLSPQAGRWPLSPGGSRATAEGLASAAVNVAYVLAALVSVVWVYRTVEWGFESDVFGFDFEGTLWDAAIAIREGRSPYPAPVLAEVEVGNPALYPPLLMFLVAPLTFLPWPVALGLWTALLGLAVAAALWILGVRDVRCYFLALVAQFTVFGVVLGNATLLLVPLVALAWRWRQSWIRCGLAVGLAIAAKLFLWPLLLWLLGTRRYRAFGAAATAALVAVFVPWALIGFDGLASYPDLLRVAEEAYAAHGYSVAAMLNGLGLELELASRAAIALGVALAVVAFVVGRRGDETAAVSIAVLAAVLGSPIAWPYYYALLVVPVAIARPRFAGVWVALTLFYASNWLSRELLNQQELEAAGVPCCGGEDVPLAVWSVNHSPPALWHALAYSALGTVIVAFVLLTRRQPAT